MLIRVGRNPAVPSGSQEQPALRCINSSTAASLSGPPCPHLGSGERSSERGAGPQAPVPALQLSEPQKNKV